MSRPKPVRARAANWGFKHGDYECEDDSGEVNDLTQCIGLDNCLKARRNSVGRLMCMSLNNSSNACLSKVGPQPKEAK
jgi:hypothetical protein